MGIQDSTVPYERRAGVADMQRDIGRLEGAVVAIKDQVSAHSTTDREDHASIAARAEAIQVTLTERIDKISRELGAKIDNSNEEISKKLDALIVERAEKSGGWKMLGFVGIGGGTVGGALAQFFDLFK